MTDKIPINRAAKSPALQEFREMQKFHFVQRCRCSSVQIVPGFSRAEGGVCSVIRMRSHPLPIFISPGALHGTPAHRLRLMGATSPQRAATPLLHLLHWFGDGFVMFMQHFRVQHCVRSGINWAELQNTKAGIWSTPLYTILQSILCLWPELQLSKRHSSISCVHLQTCCVYFI